MSDDASPADQFRNRRMSQTKRLQVIKGLARGLTRAEAAQQAGCSERVIYKWLKEPTFQAALVAEERELWQCVLQGLRSYALSAVRYLGEVAEGTQEGERHRIRAAGILLSTALSLAQWDELRRLSERMDAFEGKRPELEERTERCLPSTA